MENLTYDNNTFALRGKLTIYKANEVKQFFLANYSAEKNKETTFYLDLAHVNEIDSTILQILLSLKKTVENNKGQLKLKKSCSSFDSLLDLYNLGVTSGLR